MDEDLNFDEWNDIKLLFAERRFNEGIQTCAEKLKRDNIFLTIPSTNERDTIYLYEDGIYKPIGKEFIKKIIEIELKVLAKSHIINAVIEKIKNLTYEDKDIFSKELLDYIPLNNGVYDIKENKLVEYIPSFKFLSKIPVNYNPNAECPAIRKFLDECLYPEDIEVILEWFGFALYRNYFIKKALLIVGEGDTGKSTFVNLLTRFIGKPNIAGISLQDISNDKFASGLLYNKFLNIYDDLSFSDINETGKFKILTGKSNLSGQYKFRDAFNFENFAKLTFTANRIPPLKQKDYEDLAYFGRWILVSFDNVCAEPDPFLIDKITTSEELSGLLNIAIRRLSNLLVSGKFKYRNDAKQVRDLMQRSFNPLYSFARDCCEREANGWVSKEELYTEYLLYCETKNLPKMTKERLGRQFPLVCPVSESKHAGVTGWLSIKIKSKEEVKEEVIDIQS